MFQSLTWSRICSSCCVQGSEFPFIPLPSLRPSLRPSIRLEYVVTPITPIVSSMVGRMVIPAAKETVKTTLKGCFVVNRSVFGDVIKTTLAFTLYTHWLTQPTPPRNNDNTK